MSKRFFLPCFLLLSACSAHPLPDQVTRHSTLAIATAIRCEARDALRRHANDPKFDQGVIGYIFDFDITEHNAAGFDVTLKKPYGTGTLDLSLAGSKSDLQRRAARRFTIIDTFGELRHATCDRQQLRAQFKYPIVGSIGLDEVVGTFMGINQIPDARLGDVEAKIGGQASAFSDELTYTTSLDSGTFKPTLTMDAVPGVLALTSASANVQSTRTDIHKLTVAIALPTPVHKRKAHAIPAHRYAFRVMSGVPSKVLINSEPDPRTRVLMELDRRVLLSRTLVIAP